MQRRICQTLDGRVFTVRMAVEEDLASVLALQRDAIKEGEDFFVRTLPEFDFAIEDAAQKLTDLLEQGNSLWLVAEMNGKVIGSLDLHGGQLARIRHTAHFGMTVQPDVRGCGVGSELMDTMLAWVAKHPGIAKLSTVVFATNDRAIDLYRRLGFVEEGRRSREYLMGGDNYRDALVLAKWVKEK